MQIPKDFDTLVREAMEAPFEGWDFSYINDRRTDAVLPWSYEVRAGEWVKASKAMLDMGTGGGEILSQFAPFPPCACATESYPPNVAVAAKRLGPLGVRVVDTSAKPDKGHLPFEDECFDLVINRHEAYRVEELWRVLRPGGRFLTQQCGGDSARALVEWFTGKGSGVLMDWTLARAVPQLEQAGFKLLAAKEASPKVTFKDIGAIVYHLRTIPWIVDDFSVEKYRDRLLAMHRHMEKHGGFTFEEPRFYIEAEKPGM